MTLGIDAILVIRKGRIKTIEYLWTFASWRYASMARMWTLSGLWAIGHRIGRGYDHGRLHATDCRWGDGRWLIPFMNDGRRVGNEEFETGFIIPMITTELVELFVGEGVTEGISADFCSINRIVWLFLILDS
jgi:hypothetical protein